MPKIQYDSKETLALGAAVIDVFTTPTAATASRSRVPGSGSLVCRRSKGGTNVMLAPTPEPPSAE